MPMPTHSTIPRQSTPLAELEEMLETYRAHVDALDAELMALVARRREVSAQIQQLRVAAGGPRIQHGRERAILGHYRDALGPEGSKLALTVLELCRGRA
jgi:chorismate mutase